MTHATIANQEEETSMSKSKTLPPDRKYMNDGRAAWAATALQHFAFITGADGEDALTDLLVNLMHWCDRSSADFNKHLATARLHYEAETLTDR
jgi:hypothetical protein